MAYPGQEIAALPGSAQNIYVRPAFRLSEGSAFPMNLANAPTATVHAVFMRSVAFAFHCQTASSDADRKCLVGIERSAHLMRRPELIEIVS